MEASKFGFGEDVSPAFKFDPTDADLVANYLLPRAVDLPDPCPRAIIDDDTMSLPPWELLRKHGHGTSQQAFFFEPPSRTRNGGRKERTVGSAGTWRGQRREQFTITLLHSDGGELDLAYERYSLTFHRTGEKSKTSGWVMYEYDITSPPLPNTILTRVKLADSSKMDMQPEPESSFYQVAVVDPLTPPPQLGPSYDYHAVTDDGDEQGDALLMEDMQWQQTGEVEAVVADQNFFPAQEQVATSAGDAVQMGGYYTSLIADQGGVYYDGYGQYQEGFPCPDQEQHHAGDCGGGEEELDVVALQPMGETGGYVHRSLDSFEAAATAEYDEHGGDQEDQPNPQAGSPAAMTGASEGHDGRGETGGYVHHSVDPFEAATNGRHDYEQGRS